jgi:hypothetical protein
MLGQQRLDDSTYTIAIPVAGDRDSASPHGWDRSHRTAQSRATWLGWRRMGERSGRQGAGWCWVCMDGSGLQSAVQRIGQRRASAKASQSHPEPPRATARATARAKNSHCERSVQRRRALGWSQSGGWRGPSFPSLSAVVCGRGTATCPGCCEQVPARVRRPSCSLELLQLIGAGDAAAVALHVPGTVATLISQLS